MKKHLIAETQRAQGETSRRYKWFEVQELPPCGRRKTPLYVITRRDSTIALGHIEWHGPWRRFVLVPAELSVWSAGCLADVQDAIRWAEQRRRDKA